MRHESKILGYRHWRLTAWNDERILILRVVRVRNEMMTMANDARNQPEPESIEVVLRQGQSLRVRPIRPDDKRRLEDLFYRLSPSSRHFRFQHAKKYISEEELRQFTEVNPPQQYAVVATMGGGAEERIVADGRWHLQPDGTTAEIAFMVEDNIQLGGIGTVLLEQLAAAAARYRISRFTAIVMTDNTRMQRVFDDSGFNITKRLEGGILYYTINLTDSDEFARRQAYREHVARSAGVRRVLYPRSVAVVGASRNPASVGGALFRNLLLGGFSGTVFPINPKATSVSGVLAYRSVLDVPEDIDLAVIAVPADSVLDVVDECGRKGVPGLVIISAGFGEVGGEGARRERLLREKVLGYGMRLIGPNCLGILNNDPNVRLNATFAPTMPPAGNVSMGSESGALGLALLDHAASTGVGIAHFISIGNRLDISSNDLLEFWEDDESTGVIVLYLESFGNPRKFSRIARRVSRKKPIIAVKAGRSAAGARAASSHTGALVVEDVAVDALFQQAGVIRVNTVAEMLNLTQLLALQPLPKGPRVGILTNAGGPGILAVDACESWGLTVPPLSEATQQKLQAFLPAEASVTNPVDMIAAASADSYRRALSLMLAAPEIDSVLVIHIPTLVSQTEAVAATIRDVVLDYTGGKPVIACFMMSPGAVAELRTRMQANVPVYPFPESAVLALARAYRSFQYSIREEGRVPRFSDIDVEGAREAVRSTTSVATAGAWLMPEVVATLLAKYGIPVAETRVAMTPDEAVEQARQLKFPVVMKVRSSTISHKTDVGGVALDLRSEEEVREAFQTMVARLAAAGRGAEMEGVILQPMLQRGQEVIVGMSHDPVFGPLVMVGLGGVQVELIKDVAFSLHPLTDVDPDRMLKQLKSLPLLEGWRGSPPKDIEALKDVLLRLSALIEDFPEISEMEINPLLVFDRGDGCVAADARVMVKRATV